MTHVFDLSIINRNTQLLSKLCRYNPLTEYREDTMNWQDFFKLTVLKAGRGKEEVFFEARLKTPNSFAVHDLIISKFDHLKLNALEKKRLSFDTRKILLCHHLFASTEFKQHTRELRNRLIKSKETNFTFSTEGGGIYLFIQLMNDRALEGKKILCYTSELPLPLKNLRDHSQIQFIYRPAKKSYLSDFPTLWQEYDLLELFELKDFKASA